MKHFKLHVPVILMLVTLFFFSCEEKKNKDEYTINQGARDALYEIMNQYYYWYKEMPVVDVKKYNDPFTLLDAMRYLPIDRWSFVYDYRDFLSEMQGEFFGHGFSLGLDEDGNARIVMIYNKAQLYQAGVRRGWIVKTILGYDIAKIIKENDVDTYNKIMKNSSAEFVLEDPEGNTVTATSTRSSFTVNTVLHYDTLQLQSGVAGHLVLESFIATTGPELKEAFSFFKANNVSSLIVDLRYNGGGYLSLADSLASYMAGNSRAGQVFVSTQYNDLCSSKDTSYCLRSSNYALNISKAVFITSRSTASASESVINGLEPYLQVALVGDTTHGKPAGMDGWVYRNKYVYYPVTFVLVNAEGNGDYFDGMAPDILCADDITHDFSDRNEACLAAAINYLETGNTESGKGFVKTPILSEKSELTNNLFLDDNFKFIGRE